MTALALMTKRVREAPLPGGAENDGCAWSWTPERLCALVLTVAAAREAAGGPSERTMRTVGVELVNAGGTSALFVLLGAQWNHRTHGVLAWGFLRVVCSAGGALPRGAWEVLGRAVCLSRCEVIASAWRAMGEGRVDPEERLALLAGLVSQWDDDGPSWVLSCVERIRW